MLRIVKNIKINNVNSQLNIIYINIDLDLKMFLQRLIERFITDLFLTKRKSQIRIINLC